MTNKTCPFCKEEGEFLRVITKQPGTTIQAYVDCRNCGARGPTHYNNESIEDATDGAWFSWNDRPIASLSERRKAMPDITMCDGKGCVMADRCYRHTATPTPDRQSWFQNAPVKYRITKGKQPSERPAECAHFTPIEASDKGGSENG